MLWKGFYQICWKNLILSRTCCHGYKDKTLKIFFSKTRRDLSLDDCLDDFLCQDCSNSHPVKIAQFWPEGHLWPFPRGYLTSLSWTYIFHQGDILKVFLSLTTQFRAGIAYTYIGNTSKLCLSGLFNFKHYLEVDFAPGAINCPALGVIYFR